MLCVGRFIGFHWMLIRHSDWCTYKNGYNRVHSPPQRLQLQALIAYQNHVQPNECIRQIKITLQFIPLLFVQRVPAANVCWLRYDVVFNSIRSAIESFHVTYRCHCIVDASLFLHRRFCARASAFLSMTFWCESNDGRAHHWVGRIWFSHSVYRICERFER